jgi:hypothetical protein
MGMTFEQFEYAWCEERDKCIKYRENEHCLHTICSECEYQSVCNEMKGQRNENKRNHHR